jgi:hypothetical protein
MGSGLAVRFWFAPFFVFEDFTTMTTGDTEKRRWKSGEIVELDRKNPPLQTKGGPPSRSIEWRRN